MANHLQTADAAVVDKRTLG